MRYKTLPLYYLFLIIAALFIISAVKKSYSSSDEFVSEKDEIIYQLLDVSEPAGFQHELALIKEGADLNADMLGSESTLAAIFVDNTSKEVLVAKNVYSRIYPASTTKMMTFLVVMDELESGRISLDDEITLSHDITFPGHFGATQSPLTAGCTITVRNLLFGLMIRSYNDFGSILAEYIAGDIESFADMMNEKAYEIGATGCHFVNPHGLHEDDHYVTAYDLYIILNEAKKYDLLKEIDTYSTFVYTYRSPLGAELTDEITATNLYATGDKKLPGNSEIVVWKTGTTTEAGNCLNMNLNIADKNYSIFCADLRSKDKLYEDMGYMFNYAN